ncbi:phytanoyl-CoA dioxygenase family protein [Methylocystis parvus]|uniref:Phytanoyl-CoA dioxygenase family protein n=1 Tax=Methylocystis parvus TaxID=134 RepID=A0A6B8M9V0_9HYPH|nr:phytanoyl-CoA dioxygenase family protein [Methylocystis parvus]QGM99195.1 phytanoyl-CoA dioxygenase family protein [Methylocystis parvus]WBK00426.1 phytanoyl-CoA dioxygenase family protein [Methylocystis parvus OBBP]
MTLTAELLPGVPLIESPFFEHDLATLPAEIRSVARQLHDRGYAIIDFPDADFDRKAESIKARLAARFDWREPGACSVSARVQDAWRFDEDVRGVACNASILELLSTLYGRQAFPFQTLNFPVGTQQPVHSDHIHFCSIPERFMCGVWVALEDVHADAGPLFYFPGSHVWPSYGNEHVGASPDAGAVLKYIRLHEAMPEKFGVARETFIARKGQALIWASNLLHGGAAQNDLTRSRWSQVTHYFFEGCRYTTPLKNDVLKGRITNRRALDARRAGGGVMTRIAAGLARLRI